MNILEKIATRRKERLSKKKKVVPAESLYRIEKTIRPFFREKGLVTVIAECKKGSPSRGMFLPDYDPLRIAKEYEKGGAHALSVLTEPDFFWGAESHLVKVRQHLSLPVLRKDFIVDQYQVKESWAMGADAILLIAALLSDAQLQELAGYAREFGLEVLLEVHDKRELERALKVPVTGIGINARNLKDFSIDLMGAKDLCRLVPADRVTVAESGMKSPEAAVDMYDAGFRAFLVGEYFVMAANREDCVREFCESLPA